MKQPKPKKCRECKNEFIPRSTTQIVCSFPCSVSYQKKVSLKRMEKEKKEERGKSKIKKESLRTHKDWLKLLEAVFNTFIRQRDKDQPCISCGTTKKVQYHAGHFYSVSSHPELRFDECNVHKQCGFNCNKSKHGNLLEYAERLPLRIGQEKFEALKARRGQTLKLSIPEIQELIKHYKLKIKQLNENTSI